jgi:hypothetical protein
LTPWTCELAGGQMIGKRGVNAPAGVSNGAWKIFISLEKACSVARISRP